MEFWLLVSLLISLVYCHDYSQYFGGKNDGNGGVFTRTNINYERRQGFDYLTVNDWPRLFGRDNNGFCDGHKQSPINIDTRTVQSCPVSREDVGLDLEFNNNLDFDVINTDHYIQLVC